MVQILVALCERHLGLETRWVDGSVSMPERHAHIHDFSTLPAVRVLIMTTKTGGTGLTLTAASTVVIVDPDWNPQQDLQAEDRLHRVGQREQVTAYRLLTRGTIDEYVTSLCSSKMKFAQALLLDEVREAAHTGE